MNSFTNRKPQFRVAIVAVAAVVVLLLAVSPGPSAVPGVAAQATVTLLDNFNKDRSQPTPNVGQVFVGDQEGSNYKKAAPFGTGPNEAGYTLEKITVLTNATADDTPSVGIHADDNGMPGDALHTMIVDTSTLSASENAAANVVFDADSQVEILLDKDSTYWAVISEISTTDQNFLVIRTNLQGSIGMGTITVAPGWTMDEEGWNKTGDAEWEEFGSNPGVTNTLTVKLEGKVNLNPGVSISSLPSSVSENGTATYSVVLESAPTHDVTVTPNSSNTDAVTGSSVTFTSANWSTAQMVTLTGVDDDNTINEMVTITHEVTSSDSGYNAIAVDQFDVTVSDDDTPGVTVSETLLTVTEEDTTGDTYTLVLTTKPGMGETVTITPGSTNDQLMFNPTSVSFTEINWDQTQMITVTADADDNLAGETSTITHEVNGYTGHGSSTDTVSVTVTDNDTARVDVSTTAVTVGEGSSGTYTIKLGFKPSADVLVTIVDPVETDTDVTTDPATFTFTDTNWNGPQTVTVNAGHDNDLINDMATVTHTVSGAEYAMATVLDVAVTVTDDDVAGVGFDPATLMITEGSSDTYKVELNSVPTANVTITPTGEGLTISPPTLVFEPGTWSTKQTVTVTTLQDDDLAENEISITHASTSTDPNYVIAEAGTVVVTVTDDDTAGVSVDPTKITPSEGNTTGSNYSVVLDFKPSADVTVTITGPSGSDLTIDKTELVFTTANWDTAQEVKVTAAGDDDSLDDSHTISHAIKVGGAPEYSGVSVDSVSVTVDDDDTDGVSISPTSLGSITEGTTTSYQVKLDTVPNTTVTVTLTVPTDGGVSVGGSDLNLSNGLTFTVDDWSTNQTVQVTADEDSDAFNNTGEITHTVSGYGTVTKASDVTFSVVDNDAAGVLITDATDDGDGSFSTTINEESTTTYKLRLSSQPYPDTDVVTVTINVPMGTDITSDETSFTFDKDDWNVEKSVTLTAADDADGVNDELTITHDPDGADYDGVNATNLDVTISDNDTANLVISENTISVTETDVTETANYTVELATQPTASVTVTLSSNNTDVTIDTDAVLTGNQDTLEFTTGNWNVAQTATVTVAADDESDDEMVTINHTAGGGDYEGKSASVTVDITDDEESYFIMTPSSTNLDEGDSTKYTVTLSAKPTRNVRWNQYVSDVADRNKVSLSPTGLNTITPSQWETGKELTVQATQDPDGENAMVEVWLGPSGNNPPEFLPAGFDKPLPVFTVNIRDDDPKGLEFRASDFDDFAQFEIDIDEGETKTYGVRLKTQPTGDVEVTPESVSGHVNFPGDVDTLTFTTGNWDTFQDVTIKGRLDDDAHDPTDQINHVITGYGDLDPDELPGTLTIDIEDPDTTEFVLNGSIAPITIEVTEEDNAGTTFQLNLSSFPANPDTGANSSMTVRFDLSPGLTISPPTRNFDSSDWDTSKMFTVKALHDDDGVNETLEITPKGAGANYQDVSGDKITVTVRDDDEPDLEISETLVTVDETTTQDAYTIKPTTQPTGTFEVTLESDDTSKVTVSPQTMTFNSGDWQTPQLAQVTAENDADAFDDIVMITHTATMTSSDHDEYHGVTGDPVTVTVDDDDERGVTFINTTTDGTTDTISVNEDSSSTYRIRLTSAPYPEDDEVTVTITDPSETDPVSNPDIKAEPPSVTLDKDNWETGAEVTVSMDEDADTTHDSGTISHTVTGADYETFSVTAPSVRVNTVDNDSPSVKITITGSSVNPTEGSTDTYLVELNTQPTDTVTVTLGSNNEEVTLSTSSITTSAEMIEITFDENSWNTAETVTVTAAEDADAAEDTAVITHGVRGAEYESAPTPAPVNVTVTENDELGIRVESSTLTITEVEDGIGTDTYMVTLTAAPDGGNVTIEITPSGDTNVTTNLTSLTFSASDWGSPTDSDYSQEVSKEVEVRVSDDDDAVDDTATLAHSVIGSDYQTEGVPADSVTVVVEEDADMADVTVSEPSLTIDEESTDTYTIKLTSQPTGDVTISVEATPDDVISVNDSSNLSLTFTSTNWETAQEITVLAKADADANEDTGTITHEITSGPGEYPVTLSIDSVDVTSTDGNTRGVEFSKTAVEVEEGGATDTYQVRLGTEPNGTVTITALPDNSDVSVDPNSLEFDADDWNDYQTFTVSSIQDNDAADDSATIAHRVTGADYGDNNVTAPSVNVTVFDGDNAEASVSTDAVTVTEGESAGYTIKLGSRPVGGSVTVTLSLTSTSSPDISIDPTVLTFTADNWEDAQTVIVSAADDKDTKPDTGTITHMISGANFDDATLPDVAVTVIEDDMAMISIEPTQLTIGEGKAATYTVVLGTEPSGEVTIRTGVDNGDVGVSPSVLTFTTADWDTAQVVTVSATSDTDAVNDTAAISHTASGAEYEGEIGANVAVLVVEDGTSVRDTSSFLRSSSCDNTLALTWNSPIADDAGAIDMYRIEWAAGEEPYSSTTTATVAADAKSYMLGPLNNGVTYRVRVTALDDMSMPLWTREISAMPSDKTCISGVKFGNILADSTPVIVEVEAPEPGTQVNMRYRSLNPGVWSEVQSKVLGEDETSATFDIRGLRASNNYEVQAWLGSTTPPPEAARDDAPEASVVQTVFTTSDVPEGSTFTGGGGGSRGGKILRIEPSITSVTVKPGTEVTLSVQVWGRQNLLDNGLTDRAPSDGRPDFTWFSDAGGSFSESDIRADWRNGLADDREVRFTAPSNPGSFVIKASLDDAFDCLATQDGETADDADARCSAEIEVTVRRTAYVAPEATVPVNPSGPIPEVLADTDGVAYAVFTPVDGGSFLGDGYWVTVEAGAVADGEYIGLSMTPIGDASNVGQHWHRYTLAGQTYAIGVVDASGSRVSDYALDEPLDFCLPLPVELRSNISDIVVAATNDAGEMTVLSSTVRITPEGPVVCGKLSSVPANVAVGKVGSPPTDEVSSDGSDDVDTLPDTGGSTPASSHVVLLMILGSLAIFGAASILLGQRRRPSVTVGSSSHGDVAHLTFGPMERALAFGQIGAGDKNRSVASLRATPQMSSPSDRNLVERTVANAHHSSFGSTRN